LIQEVLLKGVFLLIIGVIAMFAVYSFRPPSGFGDAMMMMGSGRNYYLKEPIYLGLMAISVICSVLGLVLTIKSNRD